MVVLKMFLFLFARLQLKNKTIFFGKKKIGGAFAPLCSTQVTPVRTHKHTLIHSRPHRRVEETIIGDRASFKTSGSVCASETVPGAHTGCVFHATVPLSTDFFRKEN
jgi:hypothetical protein